MSGRAGHLQQTIKQGDELVANNHFGADKIKERIQDIQVPLRFCSAGRGRVSVRVIQDYLSKSLRIFF